MCLNHEIASFNPDRAEAFSARLVDTLNDGALCLMLSVGHRTGLFDAMSKLPPASSAAIASQSGLQERYVREWLAAMVTGGVVHYDAGSQRYHLPAEHAAFLCRAQSADNIAVFAQYLAVLGQVEDDIVECFKHGGGVPYERFPRFHEVMEEDSGQSVLSSLLDDILPLAPELPQKLRAGIEVLDVGCGRGRALILLAEQFPNSRFLGYDFNAEAIAFANELAHQQGLANLHFEAKDATNLDQQAPQDHFDLITTFDAVHDQANPLAVLKGIHRALKPGGVYLMQDIHGSSQLQNNIQHPLGTLLYTLSTMHCMTVSLAQGGEGLGTLWGQELAQTLLHEAGFSDIAIHQLPHDIQNDYYIIHK